MTWLRTQIVNRLAGDYFLTGLAPGGVYERRINDAATEGGTPAAFWSDPAAPEKGRRLRRSLYIIDGGEVDAVSPNAPLNAVESYPYVQYYVEANATGKTMLDTIDNRVMWLLHPDNWRPVAPGGAPVIITRQERIAPTDAEGFPGMLVTRRRFLAEYLREEW